MCRTGPRRPRVMPLAPQELQIARLAAEGLSDREIGQQLYLSHRTVSNHLYRIFPKLGITSRADLATVVAQLQVRSSYQMSGVSHQVLMFRLSPARWLTA